MPEAMQLVHLCPIRETRGHSLSSYIFFSQSLNQSVVKFATFVVQKIACQNFQYYFLLWVKKKQ